jgi:hypothetical protein
MLWFIKHVKEDCFEIRPEIEIIVTNFAYFEIIYRLYYFPLIFLN